MEQTTRSPLFFRYTFLMTPGQHRTFTLELDGVDLQLRTPPAATPPAWTTLDCCRCSNCPLDPGQHSHCPIAVHIPDLVGFFSHAASYEQLDVEIATDERSYVKHTSSSDAVSSLLGIYMVTSGCPIMDKLRPMVRFHLPLATASETTFRAMAMYLCAQYYASRRGLTPDWELRGLRQIYAEVQKVNNAFVRRLHYATDNDASINAVIRLDALASAVVMNIDMHRIDDMEQIFAAYFAGGGGVPRRRPATR